MSVDSLIMNAVSEVMGVSIEKMVSPTRKQNVVAARIIAAKILKELTCMGENEIGDVLDRDGASIQYYLKVFPSRCEYDKSFRDLYRKCQMKAIDKTT